ncbi:PREDICTED: COBW domain-containing protein 1 isoform X2 [Nelumbo nucifera]|uniref:COBW domain-containing protein 1 isoform X2 n=1 Tax=Nelumbo nucifera TaxID=4432 RepID=A0A1U8A826_NELNU|nr:PREDICTED: COBW domain-containing protein 1 isoform X2 [Nelumbo nucifera]
MEDDDEIPPLAVEVDRISEPNASEFTGKPENRRSADEDSVGVTVITGYLGAGKSTLVNFILNSQHGKKIAVILNEFGEEIGVERAMINEGDGGTLVEEWVELANGCICCTVKHSLVQALEQLVQRKERLDHILLETTGLANPAPLASVLWLDDQLEASVKLDCIITVVDAKNLRHQLYEHHDSSSFPEAYLQIAFAELEKEIHNINSLATIIHSVRCQVDLSKILDCRAYDAMHTSHLEALLKESQSLSTKDSHESSVRTLCIYNQEKVNLQKQGELQIQLNSTKSCLNSQLYGIGYLFLDCLALFTMQHCQPYDHLITWDKLQIGVHSWLEDILWEKKHSMDIYRCKGVLSVQNSDELHTIQAVREIYEIVPARRWQQEENQVNKIVFIGRNLDEDILRNSFRACV